jgi:hypothetical protein
MPHWLLKAAAQGAIAAAPMGDRLDRAARVHVTRSLTLGEQAFATKLRQCRRHIGRVRALRATRFRPRALELGTGWYPIVPIGLWLCGAERVTTIDKNPLLEPERVRHTVRLYERAIRTGALDRLLPGAWAGRVAALRDAAAWIDEEEPEALLARLGVDVIVGDARETGLDDGSIDLVVSNNTFEHVPPDVLLDILREFRRISAPRAVMSHFVDMADHYAYFDRRLSQYHYLRFSNRAWRLLNGGIQYQSRLRISDYRDLHAAAGFTVVDEEHGQALPQDLDRVPLAERFRAYPREDLLVLRAWITAVPTVVAVAPAQPLDVTEQVTAGAAA